MIKVILGKKVVEGGEGGGAGGCSTNTALYITNRTGGVAGWRLE